MRPIDGFVKSVGKKNMTIKTEAGVAYTWHKVHGLKTGDAVWIYYDFAEHRISKVVKAAPHFNGAAEEA